MNLICLYQNLTNYLYDSIILIITYLLHQEQGFVESQDSNISDDQDENFCESSTNPLHSWLRKFNEENCFDDENELENESKLDWWSKADVNRVFLS